MDAMRSLAAGEGCSADGTAASRNPLSQFVGAAMGGGNANGKQMPHGGPQQGFQGSGPHGQQGMSDVERGVQAGMGLSHLQQARARGAQQHGGQQQQFVQEFEQFRQQQQMGPHGPMMGPQQGGAGGAMMARGMPQRGGEGAWADDFQRMNMGPQPGPQHRMAQAYKESFGRPDQMGERWAGNMRQAGPRQRGPMDRAWQGAAPQSRAGGWAQEMAKQPVAQTSNAKPAVQESLESDAATALGEEAKNAADMEATRRATAELAAVMSANPKFRNSQFHDFLSKVSAGELDFEDNQVVQGPNASSESASSMDQAWQQGAKADTADPTSMDSAWDDEVAASAPAPAPLAPGAVELEQAFSQAWNESMDGKDIDFSKVWENAMDKAEISAGQPGNTESLFEQAFTQAQTPGGAMDQASPADMPYVMEGENPFSEHAQPYEEGLQFFNEGNLGDAVLAFEAAVEKEPNHADAWRMLGKTHQEHDEDRKAIACLERAVEQDAYHLDALLELGVSYVNELNQERALKNLKSWVVNNPNFQGLEVKQDEYSDGSLMDDVMQLMLEAQKWAPQDPDVQEVLGVLYNVSRDYASATKAFRTALEQKPDDYSLWNKLGATLANGSLSQEAIPAYLRALELKPKYARGWLNLGISHSNLGTYEDAAKCYLKALSLNNNASHIWSYLRICFTCMERYDLVNVADRLDIDEFRTEFDF